MPEPTKHYQYNLASRLVCLPHIQEVNLVGFIVYEISIVCILSQEKRIISEKEI